MARPMVDKNWEAEDAARTLMRAEEIKQNSKLFGAARKELSKQQKAVTRALQKGLKRR